jgi:3-oxoadipate enol-lactonase
MMAFTRANGVVLHYATRGADQGPPLVFVNSLGTDFRIWEPVVSACESTRRVVLYDQRGHGLSDASGPYALDDHVDDLLHLLDHLKISRATFVGLSFGGMIAQRLAVRTPSRVVALVLCNTGMKIGTPERWATRIATVRQNGLDSIADAVLDLWFSAQYREASSTALCGWRNMLVRTPVDGYLGACAAIRDTDLSSEVASIEAPTLCISGDEDCATSPELVRQLSDSIPGAYFSVINGVGHLPCIERPDALASLLETYLQEIGIA